MERLRRTEKDHDDYQSLMRELYHQNMENTHAGNPSLTFSDPSISRTMSIEEPHSRLLFPYSTYQPMLNSMNSCIPDNSNNLDDFSLNLDAESKMLASLSLMDNQPSQGSFNNRNPIFETDPFSMNANEAVSNFPRYINNAMPLTSRVHPYEPELQILQMRRIEEERYIRMQRERENQLLKGMNPYIDPSVESCMQHCYDPYPTYLDNATMQPYPQQMVSRSSQPSLTRPQRFSSSFFTNQAPHVPKSYLRRKFMSSSCGMMNPLYDSRSVQMRYTTIDEVAGKIYPLAKDQHGCRFLQRKFTDGSLEDKNKIFSELIEHIVELTTDPFGNYLVQRMAELCDEDQRMQIIDALTNNEGTIIEISCNMHGTRVIQKVIETLKKPEQQGYKIISALKDNIVTLMNNINGNHVAQCCLKRFLHEQNDFIIDAAIQNCVEIATNRQGCCVLQKCIVHSNDDQRNRLMSRISSYSFVLAQDPFANYLVQFLLAQKIPWVTAAVLSELKGNYGYMSMHKHSSPVVEVCFLHCEEEDVVKIIREIMAYPRFLHILQNPFGNYVIQKAVARSRGGLRASLLEAIKSHAPALRHHEYGRRVLLKIGSRKY